MKRTYEVLYIVKPTVVDEEISEIVEALANVAAENGGNVLSKGKWDRRKLAYEINGYGDGVYCLMYVEAEGNIPAVLTREFRISDDILRGIITVVDTRFVDTQKIESPKVQVEEPKDTVAVKPGAVIPTEEEREKIKAGELTVTEKATEAVETAPAAEEAPVEAAEN